MKNNFDKILMDVGNYYTEKIREFGPVSRGVDWNSGESQTKRFNELLKICEDEQVFSLNDYGCGYGALVDTLDADRREFTYFGADVSQEMIRTAKARHPQRKNINFIGTTADLPVSDFTIASGLFNVRMGISDSDWMEYIKSTLNDLNDLSVKGFAFNALTSYSDTEKMRKDLFYADPTFWFDFCMKRFSRQVALLHNYGLFEFTILVRKTS